MKRENVVEVSIYRSLILHSIRFISTIKYIFYLLQKLILYNLNQLRLFANNLSIIALGYGWIFAHLGHIQKPTNSDINESNFQKVFPEGQLCARHYSRL